VSELDLALSVKELDAYLAERRAARVATVGPDGTPHVVPLWFVWHGGALFLNSTLGNPTVEHMLRTGTAAAVIDDGDEYEELRGVVLRGRVERLGDTAPPDVERAWSNKYMGGGEVPYRRWRNRTWFRLTPVRTASWDFRKIPAAKARRDAARRREED
jgi:nitroimidazol reductase NimA-like FMN-containing flavoprotein (pyridoxamine 5'-phosphate oxidase superfamily)